MSGDNSGATSGTGFRAPHGAACASPPAGFNPSRWERLKAAWRKPQHSSERCPWCRQRDGGRFEVWERDPFLDRYTCANCGGTSLWRWEVCMIYIGTLTPPIPAWPGVSYYDIGAAEFRALSEGPGA